MMCAFVTSRLTRTGVIYMAGVIDEDGTQWEHCGYCNGWVIIEELNYEEPTEKYPYGISSCTDCYYFPKHRAENRAARLEEEIEFTVQYETTPQKTTCGHGALPGAVIYTFTGDAMSAAGAKVGMWCSEACKEAASV